MFDFVVKIIGSGISAVIYFLSFQFTIHESELQIDTTLKDPLTKEIVSLMEQGYEFQIEFYGSIIVNNKKVYKDTVVNSMAYNNGWFYNKTEIEYDSLQSVMGDVTLLFESYTPQDRDVISAFVKARIVEDSLFEKSTGFRTKILWENYIPRKKKKFRYTAGEFRKK